MNDRKTDIGLLIVRSMLALVFTFHGAQKLLGLFGGPGVEGFAGFLASLGFPFPTANAVLAGATELLGGLVLLAGTGLRAAVVPLVATMLVASLTAHSGFDVQTGGAEYPLTLAAVLVGLGLTGPGRLTLGRLAGRPSTAAELLEPAPARA